MVNVTCDVGAQQVVEVGGAGVRGQEGGQPPPRPATRGRGLHSRGQGGGELGGEHGGQARLPRGLRGGKQAAG